MNMKLSSKIKLSEKIIDAEYENDFKKLKKSRLYKYLDALPMKYKEPKVMKIKEFIKMVSDGNFYSLLGYLSISHSFAIFGSDKECKYLERRILKVMPNSFILSYDSFPTTAREDFQSTYHHILGVKKHRVIVYEMGAAKVTKDSPAGEYPEGALCAEYIKENFDPFTFKQKKTKI